MIQKNLTDLMNLPSIEAIALYGIDNTLIDSWSEGNFNTEIFNQVALHYLQVFSVLDIKLLNYTHSSCADFTLLMQRNALNPGYLATLPSSSSILISWLYFAILSDLEAEPVLICPAFVATARSAIVVSSVSPDLWLIIAV